MYVLWEVAGGVLVGVEICHCAPDDGPLLSHGRLI